MVQVSAYQYDGGGVGDSNLTQVTAHPGGSAADRVTRALSAVLTAGDVRTRDLGGTATTAQFAQAVCREVLG